MKHHILVKWNADAGDRAALAAGAEAVFRETLTIPGVHGLSVHPNVIDRPNRYDLMIVVEMEASALPLYDQSEPHCRWKEQFGPLIEKKAIFDCD